MGRIINVLIADEQSIVRAGLRFVFNSEPDIRIIGEARDREEAEYKTLTLKPDVIIADMPISCQNGFELLKKLKVQLPDVKILLMIGSESENDLLGAIQSGADGYLSKKNEVREIVYSIRKVMAQEPVLSPQFTARLIREFRKSRDEQTLSSREIQVLNLLREGLTTSEIADRLFLSSGTVSTYIHRLLQKLNLKNRAEAVAYILRQRT
jgi:DNA-binding NarL/FixJ family response regulator